MEDYQQLDNDQPKKRPVFLTVLGILSFVSLGFWTLRGLLNMVAGPASQDRVEQVIAQGMGEINKMRELGSTNFADGMETLLNSIQYTNDAFYLNELLGLLVAGLGIFAVILMWRGKRLGFHLYIISCLLRIGSFYIVIPSDAVPMLTVMYFSFTSVLFIFLYSRNLKWMVD